MRYSWKAVGLVAAFNFAGVALFPHRVATFYPRYTVRRVAGRVARSIVVIYAVHRWVKPWVEQQAAEFERGRAVLEERLGRAPTGEEVIEYLQRDG